MDFVPSFCRNFVNVSPGGKCVIDGSGLCQIEDCLIISLKSLAKMSYDEIEQLQVDVSSFCKA